MFPDGPKHVLRRGGPRQPAGARATGAHRRRGSRACGSDLPAYARLRDALIGWAQGEKLAGFLFVVATCASAALIAAWLVRRFSPHASGSGIPHVEAVLNEEIPQAPFHLIWVKFCGGVLAIGSGLALGREG